MASANRADQHPVTSADPIPAPLPDLPPAYPARAAWGTATKLRAWQTEAVEQYFAALPRDFLAVATPGAGKTTFALTVAAAMSSLLVFPQTFLKSIGYGGIAAGAASIAKLLFFVFAALAAVAFAISLKRRS